MKPKVSSLPHLWTGTLLPQSLFERSYILEKSTRVAQKCIFPRSSSSPRQFRVHIVAPLQNANSLLSVPRHHKSCAIRTPNKTVAATRTILCIVLPAPKVLVSHPYTFGSKIPVVYVNGTLRERTGGATILRMEQMVTNSGFSLSAWMSRPEFIVPPILGYPR
jgi:hypothetical protein